MTADDKKHLLGTGRLITGRICWVISKNLMLSSIEEHPTSLFTLVKELRCVDWRLEPAGASQFCDDDRDSRRCDFPDVVSRTHNAFSIVLTFLDKVMTTSC